MKLEDLTVFNDLNARLSGVTPDQTDAAVRRLKPVDTANKETVVGTLYNDTTKALYVLSAMLQNEQCMELAMAQVATDEVLEKDHREKAAILDILDDVAQWLFFSQAKMDLGFHDDAPIRPREGWQIVRQPERNHGPEFIATMMRSMLPPGDE